MTQPKLDNEGLWSDSKSSITVTSGMRVDPLNLHPADVHISDIARALSRQCRFNGHVGGYLSVARHSMWVSMRLFTPGGDAQLGLTGLLHDAAETYLGDMVRPLKQSELGVGYLEAEKAVELAIADHFGIEYPLPQAVHAADTWVLMSLEISGEGRRWTWNTTPEEDEREFLQMFQVLLSKRRDQVEASK